MMNAIVCLLTLAAVAAAAPDALAPPDPFSVDDIKNKDGPAGGEAALGRRAENAKKPGDLGPTVPKIEGLDKATRVTVEPARVEPDKKESDKKESDARSVKSAVNEVTGPKGGGAEGNLRGDAGAEGDANDTDANDTDADKSAEAEAKPEPLLKSIEDSEKKLSEAFNVVKSKIHTIGKGQKPIKVDCGTTRVRVVCAKGSRPEEAPELEPAPEAPKGKREGKKEGKEETSEEAELEDALAAEDAGSGEE